MKNKKTSLICMVLLIVICVFMFTSCASTNQRIQQALDKMESYDSVQMKGIVDMTVESELLGGGMNVDADFDMKLSGENTQMSMQTNTAFGSVDVDYYVVDGKFYMYMPQLTEKYIDASEIYEQVKDEGIGMNMAVFDFDVDSTELEPEDTSIDFEGKEANVLKVRVLLDEEQMTTLVKDLFAQQNFSTNTLSEQGAADIYNSIDIDSAEYTLYIDSGNNIIRYEVDTVFSMVISEQNMKYDMQMQYDIVDTGDSVVVELPEMQPEDVINYEDLLT